MDMLLAVCLGPLLTRGIVPDLHLKEIQALTKVYLVEGASPDPHCNPLAAPLIFLGRSQRMAQKEGGNQGGPEPS